MYLIEHLLDESFQLKLLSNILRNINWEPNRIFCANDLFPENVCLNGLFWSINNSGEINIFTQNVYKIPYIMFRWIMIVGSFLRF